MQQPDRAALDRVITQRLQLQAQRKKPAIPTRATETAPLPLSGSQRRFWLLDQFFTDTSAVRPLILQLDGPLHLQAFVDSLNEIVRRHEILRTVYQVREGETTQVVLPHRRFELPIVDLGQASADERMGLIQEQAATEAAKGFDLVQGPVFRVKLLLFAPEAHVLLVMFHHIAFDGWSASVFVAELGGHYMAHLRGHPSAVPDLPIQYADYALWQQSRLDDRLTLQELAYWREQLDGMSSELALPTDPARIDAASLEYDRVDSIFPEALVGQLEALSRREGVTLFTTLLTAFQVLLGRYSGQTDISVATLIAGRTQPEMEGLIGCFVNTVVVRTDQSGRPTFRELLARTAKTVFGALAHQETPFERVLEDLHLSPRRLSNQGGARFPQVLLQLRNMPGPEVMQAENLRIEVLHLFLGGGVQELVFEATRQSDGMRCELVYLTDRHSRSSMAAMMGHFQTLLEGVVVDPDQQIGFLPLLNEREHQTILHDWNRTTTPYPDRLAIHPLFEAQAARTPTAVAIESIEGALTYAELNRRSNRLASYLRRQGLGPEKVVGLHLERGIDMVVAVLGVLKAGGAYLPLSTNLPPERLAFMIEDAGAALVLTLERSHRLLPVANRSSEVRVLDLDRLALGAESKDNFISLATGQNLAYVIYTSGSTGQPKGVLVEQHSVSNLVLAQIRLFGLQPGSRVLQFSPLSFDASVSEIFTTLLSGATLVVPAPDDILVGAILLEILREQRITVATIPPSVLAGLPDEELPHLTTVIAAGERCSADLARRWGASRRLINGYGPTEATIGVAMGDIGLMDPDRDPGIGRPLANVQTFVLDANQQPVPVGVPGELYVGGAGVARGYCRRPDLTAASFVPNPFAGKNTAAPVTATRLYRTGDIVRYRQDGTIEFIGRRDHQVKVRGYRIELEEIESVLREHPLVRDAAVVVGESGVDDKRLVAYIVRAADSTKEETATFASLRHFLDRRLPDYMVPAFIVELEAMPMTAHGKIDRTALPQPVWGRQGLLGGHPLLDEPTTPPRTPPERQLAAIWSELLNVKEIGIDDNFFDLGGHSLLLTRLATRIEAGFGVRLPLRFLFDNPTLVEMIDQILARQVESADRDRVAHLLAELRQLSPEDVDRLLRA